MLCAVYNWFACHVIRNKLRNPGINALAFCASSMWKPPQTACVRSSTGGARKGPAIAHRGTVREPSVAGLDQYCTLFDQDIETGSPCLTQCLAL